MHPKLGFGEERFVTRWMELIIYITSQFLSSVHQALLVVKVTYKSQQTRDSATKQGTTESLYISSDLKHINHQHIQGRQTIWYKNVEYVALQGVLLLNMLLLGFIMPVKTSTSWCLSSSLVFHEYYIWQLADTKLTCCCLSLQCTQKVCFHRFPKLACQISLLTTDIWGTEKVLLMLIGPLMTGRTQTYGSRWCNYPLGYITTKLEVQNY